MAQPTAVGVNGGGTPDSGLSAAPGKRKRDSSDEGDEKIEVKKEWVQTNHKQLVKFYFEVLTSIDIEPPILKRSLPEVSASDEPQSKRQKSAEPPSSTSIADKVATSSYDHLKDMMDDVSNVVRAALAETNKGSSETLRNGVLASKSTEISQFERKALELFRREEAYPQLPSEPKVDEQDQFNSGEQMVLSLTGYAPHERRLFSSLPLSENVDLADINLPPGVSIARLATSIAQEKTIPSLGETFAPPRALPALQPPKHPKNQAKGSMLDFYHPEMTEQSSYRSGSYVTSKLTAGHYLDYSHATPASSTKTKQHERAQSLAGKKPTSVEQEMNEMDALFRGAFTSFAPCKDDSVAVVSSNAAGRMWWQRAGQRHFHNMIEIEYLEESDADDVEKTTSSDEVDEKAIRDAIDSWDDMAIDPSLEEAMGSKRDSSEKEADEILDEVGDLIETLASYQRIRNLTLPNSQNRQTSDPVNGDMLANSGPQVSEEEQATYQVLKAQLALIIKTLPPFAVAKLNGDQLDDLLISTKVEVSTDQFKGVMEEDDAGLQAKLRLQQQQQQQQQQAQQQSTHMQTLNAAQQRTPSFSAGVGFRNTYQSTNQYATPTRPPSQAQNFYRGTQGFPQQQARPISQHQGFPPQHRPAQQTQFPRQNGYPTNQYATQLAKAQTPYGHQNMPQYTTQQRPQQFGQQSGTPQSRYPQYSQGYSQGQQPGTPSQGSYGNYTNGSSQQHHSMSPQVQQPRPAFSPPPNTQQNQRYGGTPSQPQSMSSQMNRFSSQSTPQQSATGYHSVMNEAQQQRILEQAKARAAAQERSSSMFTDKIGQGQGLSGLGSLGLAGSVDVNRLAAARNQQTPAQNRTGLNGTPVSGNAAASRITPVPLPVNVPQTQQAQQQKS